MSALNNLVRRTLEREFPLQWIAGEVSNLTRAASGHVYFSLKDETAQARCVMFRSRAQLISWRLENGHQIEVRALVSIYEARGEYQLNVEGMRRAGLGRLYEAYARLKDKLAGEGLFDPARKRAIPRFPHRIGIVSSPQAAALQDAVIALQRRAPHLTCVLYPTLVQGDQAANRIAEAIALANQRAQTHQDCDVLLVIRGGGSIEDLWAFNEEAVARAIENSSLPVVVGVGHETDTTIADFVADVRAATPTAAAELVSQAWYEVAKELAGLSAALSRTLQQRISNSQQRLDQVSLRLLHPATRLQRTRDRLTLIAARLSSSLRNNLYRQRNHLDQAALRLSRGTPRIENAQGRVRLLQQRLITAMATSHGRYRHRISCVASALEHLSPSATLARGFAVVRLGHDRLVTSAHELRLDQSVTLTLSDGDVAATITGINIAEQK